MRNVIQGMELSLPEWDEWDKKLADGLKIFIISLVYQLPFTLIFFVASALLIAGSFSLEFLAYGRDHLDTIWMITSIIGTIGGMILIGIGAVLSLVVGAVIPAAICHVIATDDLSAAFRFSEWWGIFRANFAGFVISYLLMIGFLFGINLLTQIMIATGVLCCIVPFVAIFGNFFFLITASVLIAQAYQEGAQQLKS
jgi:hypothetical protein